MSHIGNKVIIVPIETSIKIDNKLVQITGKFGIEFLLLPNDLNINLINNKISVIKLNNSTKTHSFQGLYRSLLQNIIIGINNKFNKILYITGVGYKFKTESNILKVYSGFSHSTKFEIPEYLNIKLESPTKLIISGINKQQVGLFASKIHQISPPEPYKGKGISYENEKIIRKVGKTGK
jgi:large subunit ribosomal protein L6